MSKHCCEWMDRSFDPKCARHSDPWDCEDALVVYDPRFDSYSLMARLGSRWTSHIAFCPSCGSAKRDLKDKWFELLEAEGVDSPMGDEKIPEIFKTDAWWKERDL